MNMLNNRKRLKRFEKEKKSRIYWMAMGSRISFILPTYTQIAFHLLKNIDRTDVHDYTRWSVFLLVAREIFRETTDVPICFFVVFVKREIRSALLCLHRMSKHMWFLCFYRGKNRCPWESITYKYGWSSTKFQQNVTRYHCYCAIQTTFPSALFDTIR